MVQRGEKHVPGCGRVLEHSGPPSRRAHAHPPGRGRRATGQTTDISGPEGCLRREGAHARGVGETMQMRGEGARRETEPRHTPVSMHAPCGPRAPVSVRVRDQTAHHSGLTVHRQSRIGTLFFLFTNTNAVSHWTDTRRAGWSRETSRRL
jgi:hypothetical protein